MFQPSHECFVDEWIGRCEKLAVQALVCICHLLNEDGVVLLGGSREQQRSLATLVFPIVFYGGLDGIFRQNGALTSSLALKDGDSC